MDSVFLVQYHFDLLRAIESILAPNGMVYLLAPKRGSTLSLFTQKAEEAGYDVELTEKYDDIVWDLHTKFKKEQPHGGGDKIYDEDIHYPVLLQLHKSTIISYILFLPHHHPLYVFNLILFNIIYSILLS